VTSIVDFLKILSKKNVQLKLEKEFVNFGLEEFKRLFTSSKNIFQTSLVDSEISK